MTVSEIVQRIQQSATELLSSYRLGYGAKNRIAGVSGYLHQIDVSLVSDQGVYYLVECKKWQRKIGVAEILVLAGRGEDIALMKTTTQVNMLMVSCAGATSGARKLAHQFGIYLSFVRSASEYWIKIGKHNNIGIMDSTESLGARIVSGELKRVD